MVPHSPRRSAFFVGLVRWTIEEVSTDWIGLKQVNRLTEETAILKLLTISQYSGMGRGIGPPPLTPCHRLRLEDRTPILRMGTRMDGPIAESPPTSPSPEIVESDRVL